MDACGKNRFPFSAPYKYYSLRSSAPLSSRFESNSVIIHQQGGHINKQNDYKKRKLVGKSYQFSYQGWCDARRYYLYPTIATWLLSETFNFTGLSNSHVRVSSIKCTSHLTFSFNHIDVPTLFPCCVARRRTRIWVYENG